MLQLIYILLFAAVVLLYACNTCLVVGQQWKCRSTAKVWLYNAK